ncbi:MAG: hypothetical protein KCHDKBKB_02580 [Elusimicrobia bacterium]|nr:hypothetical protein [Elusimicrobiota bacterium]
MFDRIKRLAKTTHLFFILLIVSAAPGLFAVELSTNPRKIMENDLLEIIITGVESNKGLVLRITSRDQGTTEHSIDWNQEGTGKVTIKELAKGSYLLSLADKMNPKNRPLRVKVLTVGGK